MASNYLVVSDQAPEGLASQVNAYLTNGYHLVGSPFAWANRVKVAQAVCLTDTDVATDDGAAGDPAEVIITPASGGRIMVGSVIVSYSALTAGVLATIELTKGAVTRTLRPFVANEGLLLALNVICDPDEPVTVTAPGVLANTSHVSVIHSEL